MYQSQLPITGKVFTFLFVYKPLIQKTMPQFLTSLPLLKLLIAIFSSLTPLPPQVQYSWGYTTSSVTMGCQDTCCC